MLKGNSFESDSLTSDLAEMTFSGVTNSNNPTNLTPQEGKGHISPFSSALVVAKVVGRTDSPGKVSAGIELRALVRGGFGVVGTVLKNTIALENGPGADTAANYDATIVFDFASNTFAIEVVGNGSYDVHWNADVSLTRATA